ncbi:MAG: DUF1292 domain-containing protein [Clostridia bacterium]|nr:DUF1292 domain-containing protein [Clostridia bacterium]
MADMEKDYNPDIVTLSDDDGKEYTFEVIDAIESDEGRYLAMLPVFDDPQKMLEDSGELVIVKVGEENGEEYFFEIEDDDEYEFVADTFIERLQDFFEIAEQE